MAERKHENKEQETKQIIDFALKNDWVYDSISEEDFVSSGAEQKVYIKNKRQVIKLNDAITMLRGKITFIIYYFIISFSPTRLTN